LIARIHGKIESIAKIHLLDQGKGGKNRKGRLFEDA